MGATAHIVNFLALLLTLVSALVEAEVPQLSLLREAMLNSVDLLRDPRGLALLHILQGVLLLAIWYDHETSFYRPAGFAALFAALLEIVYFQAGRVQSGS